MQAQPQKAQAAEELKSGFPVPVGKPWPFENVSSSVQSAVSGSEATIKKEVKYPKFLHIRYGYEDVKDKQSTIISDQGGVSIAYEVKDQAVTFAMCRCSIRDMFNYRIGRLIASGRLAVKRADARKRLTEKGLLVTLDLTPDEADNRRSISEVIIKYMADASLEADIISLRHGHRHFWLYV